MSDKISQDLFRVYDRQAVLPASNIILINAYSLFASWISE